MRFEIYRGGSNTLFSGISGEWRWRLRATNGEIIAHGESYQNRGDCLHAIELVKKLSLYTPVQQA
jgi:uncharacterized protein YegP (UPF0339 family)